MKNSMILLAAGVAAAGGVALAASGKRASATSGSALVAQARNAPQDPLYAAGPSYASLLGQEAWRSQGSGMPPWYVANAQQTQMTQSAIDQSWRELREGVFRSDPNFWA